MRREGRGALARAAGSPPRLGRRANRSVCQGCDAIDSSGIADRCTRRRAGSDSMNALDWLSEASRQPIRPVYAVFGDDVYLVREAIRLVAQAVFPVADADAAISRFAAPVTELAAV